MVRDTHGLIYWSRPFCFTKGTGINQKPQPGIEQMPLVLLFFKGSDLGWSIQVRCLRRWSCSWPMPGHEDQLVPTDLPKTTTKAWIPVLPRPKMLLFCFILIDSSRISSLSSLLSFPLFAKAIEQMFSDSRLDELPSLTINGNSPEKGTKGLS